MAKPGPKPEFSVKEPMQTLGVRLPIKALELIKAESQGGTISEYIRGLILHDLYGSEYKQTEQTSLLLSCEA